SSRLLPALCGRFSRVGAIMPHFYVMSVMFIVIMGLGLAFRPDPDNVDLVSRTFRGHVRQMINHKTKYALKALVVLADEKAGEATALRIEEIAERTGAPKRFLEHILLD